MERGRSYHKEDPRRWINFSFGLHAEISVGVVTKWRRKRGKIVGLNARLPPYLFFFLSSTRIFRGKVVYIELGSF